LVPSAKGFGCVGINRRGHHITLDSLVLHSCSSHSTCYSIHPLDSLVTSYNILSRWHQSNDTSPTDAPSSPTTPSLAPASPVEPSPIAPASRRLYYTTAFLTASLTISNLDPSTNITDIVVASTRQTVRSHANATVPPLFRRTTRASGYFPAAHRSFKIVNPLDRSFLKISSTGIAISRGASRRCKYFDWTIRCPAQFQRGRRAVGVYALAATAWPARP
jgi:hypothetical protein